MKMENRNLEKYEQLLKMLTGLERVAIAFSGGVDSSFLLYAAKEVLGDQVLAVTVSSALVPQREQREAAVFCAGLGVRQLELKTDVLGIPGLARNPANRCYICKRELFGRLIRAAANEGFGIVAEGSNLDDLGDYRPGLQAIRELGVRSPLCEAKLTKAEIRRLSESFKLPTWNKPSLACLASRIPYGETISEKKLRMVEQAEELLLNLGFEQFRVRIHQETLARIEILPEDFERLMAEKTRRKVYAAMREIGFSYVAMDLLGYRSGSMNESL